ncbi:MAG: hypothetical protein ACK5CV_09380 [Bacteroidota bacterium]|jgi:dihydroorotase
MPRILLQKARIIDAVSHEKSNIRDIYIEDGIIRKIGIDLPGEADIVISSSNLCVSNAFIDLRTHYTAPGTDNLCTPETLASEALRGGFTRICLWGTAQFHHNLPQQIHYLKANSEKHGVTWDILAALSHDQGGKILNEWFELHQAGAAGFCHRYKGADQLTLLSIAMRYTSDFGAVMFLGCSEESMSASHLLYDTPLSLSKGIKGIPTYSETAPLAALLELLDYENRQAHFSGLSLLRSIDMLENANSIKSTCDVPAMALFFDEDDINLSHPECKVFPPLFTSKNRHGLVQAAARGSIRAICSMHTPVMPENKQVEWQLAEAGANTLRDTFSMAYTALKDHMPLAQIIDLFTSGPAGILGLSLSAIEEGAPANLCVFNPDEDVVVQANTALERKAKGKIIACISGNHTSLSDDKKR